MAILLLIEDDPVFATLVSRHFQKKGHGVEVANDGSQGFHAALRLQPDLVMVDFQLPGMDGLEIIRALRKFDDPPAIVMVTAHASVSLALDAMKAGSMDLLTKPVPLKSLDAVVTRALVTRSERRALHYYRSREARNASMDALVGVSPTMQRLRDQILVLANAEPIDHSAMAPILITGETGTGKELVAKACHHSSARSTGPFIEINCAALPAALIEGELFGHEPGAFTDARERKIGLIEAADGGTLFLDEVGELELPLQAKILRVLEDFRVRRLGALTDRRVNVRLIAATNRNLEDRVRAGQFRADLLYRLKIFHIHLEPLRSHVEDIPALASHFLAQMAARYGRAPLALGEDALLALVGHDWPGNVRELRNVLERAVLIGGKGPLGLGDLPFGDAHAAASQAPALPHAPRVQQLEAVERFHLQRALQQTFGNVSKAAKLLGISRDTLRYRMERYGLSGRPDRPDREA